MADWMHVNGNKIHRTARIHPDVILGEGNVIHANVVIDTFKRRVPPIPHIPHIAMGNNNVIHEGVRILCDQFAMGDKCTLHNHVFIDGFEVRLLDNVWVGQYSHIDGYAYTHINNNVTIGYNCYIWNHAGRSGIVSGIEPQPAILGDGVWLMGANVVVNPGVIMESGSRALSNSVVTKSTKPNCTYGGVPAKEITTREITAKEIK